MFYLCTLEVYQHKAFQYTMIKHQVYFKLSTTYLHSILSAYKSKATPHLQEELLHMVFQSLFQIAFFITLLLGETSKFKYEGISDYILWSLHQMPFVS